MEHDIRKRFAEAIPVDVEFCSVRVVRIEDEQLAVRQDVIQPVQAAIDQGAMVSVALAGALGYACTPDLSRAGLKRAAAQAMEWAKICSGRVVASFWRPGPIGKQRVRGPAATAWSSIDLKTKVDRLKSISLQLRGEQIVDWEASVWHRAVSATYLTSQGDDLVQDYNYVVPMLTVVAHRPGETQRRTLGGHAYCRQGGWEVLDGLLVDSRAMQLRDDARQLLQAPNCPAGEMALLLAPDQMLIQIHESIGHPLELDRILGDERNYAGTSFVTPAMFGSYRYGSELLNVTFDPDRPEQFATYAFDDEGEPARREYLIRQGILLRGLGGAVSQRRSGLPGVAASRAESWNRPPIDRMANLNLEPGDASFEDLVSQVERGVFLRTNCSWSIDDARNKFQFGCEWGQMIERGRLTTVVKNPNYRGISATFWRNLVGVGDPSTLEILGSPYCGKGEPQQAIRVGHASPACLFSSVSVFGGEAE
jgi:predicted Zn-dependent protease